MKFSKDKFQSLSSERQIRKYLQFIDLIEKNWNDEDTKTELLNEFYKCLQFAKDKEIRLMKIGDDNLRNFIQSVIGFQRKYGQDKRDYDLLIHSQDGRRNRITKPIYLVLDEIRSAFNIGSIFRTAECFGIEEIILIGYTAGADNAKVMKTSMGTAHLVTSKSFENLQLAKEYLKNKSVTLYAMETVEGAQKMETTRLKFPAAFVFGNEALGVSAENLKLVDEILEISLSGWKNSLNVAVTAAICCYEANKQL